MPNCDLCDLATPDPPVTGDGVDGTYCCRGCLEVARRVDDPESTDPDRARSAVADGADGPAVPDDAAEAYLAVDGMHCATCEAFLEATATDHEGILDAEASYAAELLRVRYDPDRVDPEAIPDLVGGMGYTARHRDDAAEDRADRDTPWRLYVGAFVAMQTMMWYAVLYPRYLGLADGRSGGNLLAAALACTAVGATVVLGYTGGPILRGAYVSLRTGRPNMDLLIALAAGNAYVYSLLHLLSGGTEVYFDIVVTVVMVVTVGNHYESRVKRRALGLLSAATDRRVETARRRDGDGGVETVPVEDVDPGDELVVRPGERIPLDGTVTEGRAAVDESLVTGESIPVEKGPGDPAVGGSVVTDDALVVTVDEEATSTLDRLVSVLWSVQSGRTGVQRVVDRVAAVFVPAVVLVAVGALTWRLLSGADPVGALLVALSVLVVSCPCALGLATPLAVASGLKAALSRGIVVAEEGVFERASDVDVVAFDKTGTLTTGDMSVTDPGDARAREVAAAVETYASHPIAEAIVGHTPPPADLSAEGFTRHPGQGVEGRVSGAEFDDAEVVVGRPSLFEDRGWSIPPETRRRAETIRDRGNVPVLVGWDGAVRSAVGVGDRPRDGWASVVEELGEDRRVVVITGDDRRGARRFAEHPAVDEVLADVRPAAKASVVERLRAEGVVAMVGDGANDAPALGAADLGIAVESGVALATEAADVVVGTDDLAAVPTVFDLARATNARIRQNLGWAFVYNAIAIPVAAAGLLNPLFAAAAMAASSLLVVGNSTRALVADPVPGDSPAIGGEDDGPAADRDRSASESTPSATETPGAGESVVDPTGGD